MGGAGARPGVVVWQLPATRGTTDARTQDEAVIWLLQGCYKAVTWLLHGCYDARTREDEFVRWHAHCSKTGGVDRGL